MPPFYKKLASEFDSALVNLANTFPGRCTTELCPNVTAEGRPMRFVRITKPGTTPKTPVLIMAGIHAREWAPPDALLSFATDLLSKGTTGAPDYNPKTILYRPFFRNDISPPVRFPRRTVHFRGVSEILSKVDLYVLPLVNPDGREFSFTPPTDVNRFQRKNRRNFGITTPCIMSPPTATGPGVPLDLSKGVDLNRNFDIGWDVDTYYDPAFLPQVRISKTPCGASTGAGALYRGPTPFSEAETKNIKFIMDTKNIQFFVDLHSHGRDVLFSWSAAHSQKSDATKNYQNPTLNTHRDAAYGEFLPSTVFDRAHTIAGRMSWFIHLMRSRDFREATDDRLKSEYKLGPDITTPIVPGLFRVPLYPAPGSSTDHLNARQLSTVTTPPFAETLVPPERYGFTIEAGSEFDGEFWPDFVNEFPKIEREIHLALWGLLSVVARPGAAPSWPIEP